MLFHAPWGLAPPGAPPREGSDGHAFLESYAGGWQELFPSADEPCTYRGHDIGYHGEVAAIPWQVRRRRAAVAGLHDRLPDRAVPPRAPADAGRRRRRSCGSTSASPTPAHEDVGVHVGPPPRARPAVRRAGRPVRARCRARSSRSRRCTRTRRASSRASAAPGPTRSCAPAAPSTCGELPGPRGRQPRRHVPDRPLRRHAARHQPGARPGAAAGLGSGRLPLDHRVAAVRRRRGDAAHAAPTRSASSRGSRRGRWPTRPPVGDALSVAGRRIRSRPPSP